MANEGSERLNIFLLIHYYTTLLYPALSGATVTSTSEVHMLQFVDDRKIRTQLEMPY
jgi:hypothetical protein